MRELVGGGDLALLSVWSWSTHSSAVAKAAMSCSDDKI
jgi:hypothetical protein